VPTFPLPSFPPFHRAYSFFVPPSAFPFFPLLSQNGIIVFIAPSLILGTSSPSLPPSFLPPSLPPLLTKELNKNPPEGVSVGLVDDSLFEWELLLVGPADTLYEGTSCPPSLTLPPSCDQVLTLPPSFPPSLAGGFFKARLAFPNDFPNMPPTMTFQTEMWHPNGEEGGRGEDVGVCLEGRQEGAE